MSDNETEHGPNLCARFTVDRWPAYQISCLCGYKTPVEDSERAALDSIDAHIAECSGSGRGENACRDCGIDNPVWFAPNDVWNAVMGDHTGFLCPRCFIVRAEASGLRPTAWVLTPEVAGPGGADPKETRE